jgi:hypothetical protein
MSGNEQRYQFGYGLQPPPGRSQLRPNSHLAHLSRSPAPHMATRRLQNAHGTHNSPQLASRTAQSASTQSPHVAPVFPRRFPEPPASAFDNTPLHNVPRSAPGTLSYDLSMEQDHPMNQDRFLNGSHIATLDLGPSLARGHGANAELNRWTSNSPAMFNLPKNRALVSSPDVRARIHASHPSATAVPPTSSSKLAVESSEAERSSFSPQGPTLDEPSVSSRLDDAKCHDKSNYASPHVVASPNVTDLVASMERTLKEQASRRCFIAYAARFDPAVEIQHRES